MFYRLPSTFYRLSILLAIKHKFVYDESVRKVQIIIFISFLLSVLFLFSAQGTLGFSCIPKVTVDTGNNFNTIVNFGSVAPNINDKDWLIINNQKIPGELTSNRDLIFQIGKLTPGDYSFNQQTNNSLVCRGTINVPDVGQGGTTEGNLEITPPNPTSTDYIRVIVKNLAKDSIYAIYLSKQNANLYAQDTYKLFCVQSANKQLDADIGTYTDGAWSVNVSEKDPNSGDICRVSKNGVASGKFTISAFIISPTPTSKNPSPCAKYDEVEKEKCIAVDTAIGKISTEPQGFVRSVFSLVLGLAGGIALILIILSGYKMMASQGNPEQITAARDQLISAIVGLLFIIFSFVILQVIGVDILRIPGFSR